MVITRYLCKLTVTATAPILGTGSMLRSAAVGSCGSNQLRRCTERRVRKLGIQFAEGLNGLVYTFGGV